MAEPDRAEQIEGGTAVALDVPFEERLEAVESAIKEIKQKLEDQPISSNWLDQVIGILRDEPEFDEVIRLGREFRSSDQPAENPVS